MKNILMIAYYFPPLGGAGVQRTLKFAKYLNKFGYNVSILTVHSPDVSIEDASLEKEIGQKIKIYRAEQNGKTFLEKIEDRRNKKSTTNQNKKSNIVPNKNVFKTKFKSIVIKILRDVVLYIYRTIYIPDEKISWKKNAVKKGLEIIKNNKIDILYSTSDPYTDHLIAYELKKETNLPWIADFRDAWASNPFVRYPLIAKIMNKNLEREVVNSADAIVSVSDPIIDDMKIRYGEKYYQKFNVITNGYDEEDFKNYNMEKRTDVYTITYNGTLYGNRSPKNFFIAIENLINENKIDKNKIKVRFVGVIGRDAGEEINRFKSKYNNIVECINYLPHFQSIKYIENSSSLLLLINNGKGSDGIYTGKLFEYIRSGRDIIGLVPKGVARNLICSTNSGYCCFPDSIVEIEDALYKSYIDWENNANRYGKCNWDEIKKYNRENISKRLQKIIEIL